MALNSITLGARKCEQVLWNTQNGEKIKWEKIMEASCASWVATDFEFQLKED